MRHCTCAPVFALNADGTRVVMPSCYQLPNLGATPAPPLYPRQRGVYDQQQGLRYHPYQCHPLFQGHYIQHQPLVLSYSTRQPDSLQYQDSHYRIGMYSNHLPCPDPILPQYQRWGRDQTGFRPAYQRPPAFQPPHQQ
ncbi:hypothetical protein EC957_001259 [Mortierella hygrophila]|uniref:Uncharacterized protein n=1 Tax=Mortierella hygrophila TaxID=979708 RepID=A0A9P6F6H1_9FUNG|nr:hypothetical protein EC957_001259 [Mortierella hygrophila]